MIVSPPRPAFHAIPRMMRQGRHRAALEGGGLPSLGHQMWNLGPQGDVNERDFFDIVLQNFGVLLVGPHGDPGHFENKRNVGLA